MMLLLVQITLLGAATVTGFAPTITQYATFSSRTAAAAAAPPTTTTQLFSDKTNGVNGASPKKVIVLGGDGFCGWPTSLYLSDQGHDITIVDNLSRRNIDIELGCDSLTPIQSPEVSWR
jgi:UDP-sulfoquinovose synthase